MVMATDDSLFKASLPYVNSWRNEMDELKNCPFCSVSAVTEIEFYAPTNSWRGVCQYCRAEGPHESTPEEAIKAWNRRASPWTPVEERLPTTDTEPFEDEYLVFLPFIFYIARFNSIYQRWEISDDDDLSFDSSRVTHWMLPEPPEGRKE